MRAGAHALSLLSIPLNVSVLRALRDEPTALIDLRRAVGFPPESTLRAYTRSLTEEGVLERRREGFPGAVTFALAPAGEELLAIADVLERWLNEAPEGPVPLGSSVAKTATRALIEGWSTKVVRALAARPLSLIELSRLIPDVTYPSLERRLTAMRLAGQIEVCPGANRGTNLQVSGWLRRSIAPLAVAVRWERRHGTSTQPLGRMDSEAAFLLAVPLLRMSDELSGSCRLTVEFPRAKEHRVAGVTVQVRNGAVESCVSRLEGNATAWATGSVAQWLQALIDGDPVGLEVGGDGRLATAHVDGLHASLFMDRRVRG